MSDNVSQVGCRLLHLSIVLTTMLSTASSAALYMCQAPDGSWMFSDFAVRGGEYKLVRKADSRRGIVAAARGGNAAYRGNPSAYDRLIRRMGRMYGVDAALIKAVMHLESAFNPYATSRKGALGLMQLMSTTAQRYGAREAYDPVQNVRAAVKYLKDLIERYNNKPAWSWPRTMPVRPRSSNTTECLPVRKRVAI